MINQYLMQLPPGTGLTLYNLLGYLQFPAFVGMLIWATIKYPRPTKEKIVVWVAFLIARFWGGGIVPVWSRLTDGIIPAINLGVAFCPFVLIVAAIVYCVRVPVLFSLDVVIPAFVLGRGLAISGCIFTGCCHGFPVSWGIYSNLAGTFTFPTVVLDIVASCGIVIYSIFLAKKNQYSGNGMVAAMGMVLFGLLRILIDLMRDDEKLVWMLTAEGLFGIAYVAAGCLLLRALFIRGEKI